MATLVYAFLLSLLDPDLSTNQLNIGRILSRP
jgi:hypothetical protein